MSPLDRIHEFVDLEDGYMEITEIITKDEMRRRYPEHSGIPDEVIRPSPVIPFTHTPYPWETE